MGISHCYASPLLKAREGSPHGYDISDHKQLNAEIGSREDFIQLATALKAEGMGLVLDTVPNHMGAGRDNPWWMDVLENGTSSMYSDYFDVDWNPLQADLKDKILLPILGNSYGNILKNGEIQLRFEEETARFWLDYYENAIPVNPVSYPLILSHRLDVLEARLGKNNPAFLEFQSISTAFERLPVENDGNWAKKEERVRERTIALNRLITLGQQTTEIFNFIQENVRDFLPEQDDPTNLSRLHRLLEMQVYRLSNWRVASDEINYRRFFDVNDLVAIRVEDQRVFNDTHDLIMELIQAGLVTGLRLDHPDGLYNPAAYFRHLQVEAARRLELPIREDWKLGDENLPFYVLIEKILAPFERLPQEWVVQGTTGYEFANAVNGLFINQDNEKEFTRIYDKLLGERVNFEELVHECKKLIMRTTLNSELGVLTQQLYRICKQNWSCRDFTLHNLRSALMEIVASFPVYRTYVTPDEVSKKDREYIDWAVNLAKRKSTAIDTSIFNFIRSVLLLEAHPETIRETVLPNPTTGEKITTAETDEQRTFRAAVIHFAMKFQQYSGPVMAKGMEDTTFYRYNRLISLNEVGGEPKVFGISPATFHHRNQQRMKQTPHTMLATSTHDTKRSEDVRARISVLSEIPEDWQKHLTFWRRMHRHLKRTIDGGEMIPSANDEYLFYQTLVGVWPYETPNEEERAELAQRMEAYMLKAAREAKSHTSWINPNTEYEEALCQYIRGILLKPSQLFLRNFLPFQRMISRFGIFNSLSQTLLKLTVPGVPDIYQGTELWDLSLVDPDNRRRVQYSQRQHHMESLQPLLKSTSPRTIQKLLGELTRDMPDGRIKQYLILALLNYRQEHANLFKYGAYVPLEVTGASADHVVAFARIQENEALLVIVPRLNYTLGLRRTGLPCGKRLWKDTVIQLPEVLQGKLFENLLTRETLLPKSQAPSELEMAEILKDLPIGVLTLK